MPYDARLQTNEPWFIQIQRICGCENPKPYVSKPLSNSEIRRVYRNEYYRIDDNRYFQEWGNQKQKEISKDFKAFKESLVNEVGSI